MILKNGLLTKVNRAVALIQFKKILKTYNLFKEFLNLQVKVQLIREVQIFVLHINKL